MPNTNIIYAKCPKCGKEAHGKDEIEIFLDGEK